jgi:indole-3-glycerol phosphate synthase
MSILEDIVSHKKVEVGESKSIKKIEDLFREIELISSPISLLDSMREPGLFHFICEVKKASPSKGIIQSNFDPVRQAQLYQSAGASGISVLTDEKYFAGKLDYLSHIKDRVQLPVLRKDFIIDPFQIYEARAAGADLILLIARILTKKQLAEYLDIAKSLNLEVLLELADEQEIEKFPRNLDSVILGINNRDLRTFTVDINNSLRIKKRLPDGVPVISESGIKTAEDCQRLYDDGFSGVLIGETLMRSNNPVDTLSKMKAGIQLAK